MDDPVPAKNYQTSIQPQVDISQSLYSTSVVQNNSNEGPSINFLDAPVAGHKNIVVPYVPVISETDSSREGKYSNLSVKAAFQRESEKVCLQLLFNNQSSITMDVHMF